MRDLLRAVFKTGSGSAASLILGMITMKIMAVVLGPAGVGLFSLLRQSQQTAVALAVLNGQMAVVQGTASREGKTRTEYLATVLGILTCTAGAVSLGFLIFAPQLSGWIVGQTDVSTVATVRWLALSVFFSAAAAYLASLLNGYRAVGRVVLVKVSNFALMALLAYPAAKLVKVGYPMAFAWLLTASAMSSFFLGGWFAFRAGWLVFLFDKTQRFFSYPAARYFIRLAGAMLVTGIVGTVVPLAMRALVANRFGLHDAGIFDVAWTLSMAYVMLILTSFSTYYLPTLTQTHDLLERPILIRRVFRLTMLLIVPLVVTVITLKPLVIKLLYTAEFLPSLEVMRWMLIGDYLKVFSWVFAFTMIAYSDMRTYLWTEILWGTLTLIAAAVAVINFNSMQGIGVIFLFLYISYLGYTLYYVYQRHNLTLDATLMRQWLIGLVLVLGASAETWNATQVNWVTAGLWLMVTLLFSLSVLNKNERQKAQALIVTRYLDWVRR